jgi:hypothetical protein
VTAGARPEYFQVILAMAATGASARCSSVSSMTNLVSVFTGRRYMALTLGLRHAHSHDHVRNMMRGMDPNESPTFVPDPVAACVFQDVGGFKTKTGTDQLDLRKRAHAGMCVLGLSACAKFPLLMRQKRDVST